MIDIKETSKLPILLGRLFLATARTRINVHDKVVSLEVGYEKVIANMDKFKKGNDKHDAYVIVIETFDAPGCVSVHDKQGLKNNIFKIETLI